MILCSRNGCSRAAACAPKICVPVSAGVGPTGPLEAIVGLPLCDRHLGELRVADFLADTPGKPSMRLSFVLMAGRHASPNFARAHVVRVDLDSDEWRAAVRARHGG